MQVYPNTDTRLDPDVALKYDTKTYTNTSTNRGVQCRITMHIAHTSCTCKHTGAAKPAGTDTTSSRTSGKGKMGPTAATLGGCKKQYGP